MPDSDAPLDAPDGEVTPGPFVKQPSPDPGAPKPFLSTPLGNIVVLGATIIIILVGVWAVGTWRGGNSQGSASGTNTGGEGGSVTAVEGIEGAEGIGESAAAPEIGEPAPVFTGTTLTGEEFELANTEGKPVWLVFNATWCSNCRAEIPDIEEAYKAYGDRIEVVSVYISDTPAAVSEYSETLGLTYPEIVDVGNQISAMYRVMGIPAHYFIDADGTLEAIQVGVLTEAQMEEHIQQLIN